MDVHEEGLYFNFENGLSYSKGKIKDYLKFMIDLTIESCQFLIQANRIMNQKDCHNL